MPKRDRKALVLDCTAAEGEVEAPQDLYTVVDVKKWMKDSGVHGTVAFSRPVGTLTRKKREVSSFV